MSENSDVPDPNSGSNDPGEADNDVISGIQITDVRTLQSEDPEVEIEGENMNKDQKTEENSEGMEQPSTSVQDEGHAGSSQLEEEPSTSRGHAYQNPYSQSESRLPYRRIRRFAVAHTSSAGIRRFGHQKGAYELQYSCQFCRERFATIRNLNAHLTKHYYECDRQYHNK